jgi:hypothetical protein
MIPGAKTAALRAHYAAGEKKEALKIAASFRMDITREEHNILKKGYECFHYGDTYRQMGVDPDAAIEAAWQLLGYLPFIRN